MTKQSLWRKAFVIGMLLPALALGENQQSSYRLTKDPERRREVGWVFLSYLLPGMDQWVEGQTNYAMVYSSLALGGAAYAAAFANNHDDGDFRSNSRHTALGLKLYDLAGSMSLFHGFRSVVYNRQLRGEYDFLKEEESPEQLAIAPFRFDYLIRPTTLIPLAITAGIFYALAPPTGNAPFNLRNVTGMDAYFSGGISYMAGVGEEMVYRGTLMPLMHERWKNPFLSNLLSSTFFAAAHLDFQNPKVPWVQFIAGMYLGWVSQFRNWTLSESIFIHTWYDVIVFTSYYATQKQLVIPLPQLRLSF